MQEHKEEHPTTLFSEVIEIDPNMGAAGAPKHILTRLQRAAILQNNIKITEEFTA